MIFEREELIALRDKADKAATVAAVNPHWRRAYEELSHAANALDAMTARCTVGPQDKEQQNAST